MACRLTNETLSNEVNELVTLVLKIAILDFVAIEAFMFHKHILLNPCHGMARRHFKALIRLSLASFFLSFSPVKICC